MTPARTPRNPLGRNPERHLLIGVGLNQDHIAQQNVKGKEPFPAGAAGVDVVNADFIPVRANRRPHPTTAAHHAAAHAVENGLLDVGDG